VFFQTVIINYQILSNTKVGHCYVGSIIMPGIY